MDGVSQYVTVRRDLFTGLVANSATTLPVATLAISEAPENEEETLLTGGHCSRDLTNHHILAVGPSTASARSTPTETSVTPTALLADTNGMQHDCSICAKTFSSKSLLTRHMKGQHQLLINPATAALTASIASMGSSPNSATELKCDQCKGRSFQTQVALIKHLKSQHQITLEVERSSPILATAGCPTTEPGNGSLIGGPSRSDNKRQPGEKRFQCGQCSKRFPTSKDLKRHDVVHTGNREFQCSFCSHRFGRKDHRMRHEKKTHANELLSSSPISPKTADPINQSTVFVKQPRGVEEPLPAPPPPTSGSERKRWRHVSSPSIASSDFDMAESPIRLRAMSTSEPVCPPHQSQNQQNQLFSSDLKYLESQLSPDSLQETGSNMSPDLNSVKEEIESEDTCLSHGSEDTCKSDLDWIMSDFMVKTSEDTNKVVESVLSPSPDSASLSPPGFYTDPGPPPALIKTEILEPAQNSATPSTPPVMPPLQPLPQCPKQLMSDFLTRTKNPVLPSVYIDNSLIVPEPSKQKYHNPHPLLSPEDMDDYYEAFMDDKDITETLFHV